MNCLYYAAPFFRLAAIRHFPIYVRPRVFQGRAVRASDLFAAAAMGDTIALDRMIVARANVNARWNEFTPLMAAVLEGHRSAAKRLLAAKADPNIHPSGLTAFLCAVRNQDYRLVELLLQNGANAKALIKGDLEPVYLAKLCGNDS
jgi:ankyrin repeat protein